MAHLRAPRLPCGGGACRPSASMASPWKRICREGGRGGGQSVHGGRRANGTDPPARGGACPTHRRPLRPMGSLRGGCCLRRMVACPEVRGGEGGCPPRTRAPHPHRGGESIGACPTRTGESVVLEARSADGHRLVTLRCVAHSETKYEEARSRPFWGHGWTLGSHALPGDDSRKGFSDTLWLNCSPRYRPSLWTCAVP